jgi:hypothetical protein
MFLFETSVLNWIEPFDAIPDFAEINQEGDSWIFRGDSRTRKWRPVLAHTRLLSWSDIIRTRAGKLNHRKRKGV